MGLSKKSREQNPLGINGLTVNIDTFKVSGSDCISVQQMPCSDSSKTQSDLGLLCPRMFEDTFLFGATHTKDDIASWCYFPRGYFVAISVCSGECQQALLQRKMQKFTFSTFCIDMINIDAKCRNVQKNPSVYVVVLCFPIWGMYCFCYCHLSITK